MSAPAWGSLNRPEDTNWEEHSAVADLSTGRRFKAVQSVPSKVAIDEVSDTVTYVGTTKPGVATTDPYWRIKKITVDGTETLIEFAGGSDSFTNQWSEHLTYTYS